MEAADGLVLTYSILTFLRLKILNFRACGEIAVGQNPDDAPDGLDFVVGLAAHDFEVPVQRMQTVGLVLFDVQRAVHLKDADVARTKRLVGEFHQHVAVVGLFRFHAVAVDAEYHVCAARGGGRVQERRVPAGGKSAVARACRDWVIRIWQFQQL